VRRNEQVGKPFELSFTDATTGNPVSIGDLKGKVVVVDFWATWCGPCVAEMPKMKQLYAEYKPKGVEFVGVSLDQPESKGGLTALKEFVAKNEIKWPQYYQGKFWDSEFSTSWGVNSIPCMFVLDADGNLVDAYAREKLEKLLPELIAKRDKQSADAR
jgi:thiol-disulfide isomerase/thioredoxin